MRIAIFSWESLYAIKIGGAGIHVFNLARSLQRAGNEVHIFTRQGESLSMQDMIEGVYIHRLPWNRDDSFISEVRSFNNTLAYYYTEISSKVGKFDILHCHEWLTFDAGLRLKNETKLIATFHTTELGRSGHWPDSGLSRDISNLERKMTESAFRIIAISYEVRRELELLYKIPDWKTEVIYHGIDTNQYRQASEIKNTVRADLNISPSAKIILFAGSFSLKKGTDILLNTCKDVIGRSDKAVYVFYGTGELEGRVDGVARDFPGKIIVLNTLDPVKLQHLFREAYLVVSPFRSDPFGIITLTAWTASKPVVCLNKGASSEITYNDVNGIISSEENFAGDLLKLLENPKHVKWLGNNARVTIDTAFTWDEIAKLTEKLYRSAD